MLDNFSLKIWANELKNDKPLSNLHPSYLQDTPVFFRCIEEINKDNLPANSTLFSVDVTGLYTNIPQDDGLEFCEKTELINRYLRHF